MPNDVFLIAKKETLSTFTFTSIEFSALSGVLTVIDCKCAPCREASSTTKNYDAYSWQDSIIVVKLKIICSIAQTRHQQWILIHWFPISPLGWFLAWVKRLISASGAVFTCDPHKSLENHQNHQMGQFSTNFVQISHDWKKVEHRRFKGKTHLWTFDCRRKNVQW